MKKYFAPDMKLLACDVCDVITSSGTKISVDRSTTPDAENLPDYANF